MDPATTWKMIATKLKQGNVQTESYGLHALRHSCATKLLRDGSSLKDVAEFLGHSSMSSVSIYAKFDLKTLTQVAAFSLAGVL
jgi:site-specific recombinase XerD